MKVEVCHADAHGAIRIALELPAGATVDDALAASDVFARLGLDPSTLSFGVFGRRAALTDVLADGDRVEIYRPLTVDPKDARRRRAEVRRAARKA